MCSGDESMAAPLMAEPVVPAVAAKEEHAATDSNAETKNLQPKLEAAAHEKVATLQLQASVGVTPENFKTVAYDLGKVIMQRYNGPVRYLLEVCVGKGGDGNELAQSLRSAFGCQRSDVRMVSHPADMPQDETSLFVLQLHDSSYFPESSTKPAPYLTTCLQLWDEILTHGFITQGPLAVCHAELAFHASS